MSLEASKESTSLRNNDESEIQEISNDSDNHDTITDRQKVAASANNNGEDPFVEPTTDFVTTSYVLDSLNSALDKLNPPTGENSSSSQQLLPGGKRTFFELQKRLPDGSTRKATDEEMSSADMKNKLEQAAKYTENMSLEQKIEWAQKQRQHGNELYQEGKYKEAIDIYLTCLVVRDTAKQDVDQEVLILPVMNNLAQCTLQLGWYQKTEHFCTLAMESINDVTSKGPLVAKLYFKRAKARRLRGMYKEAKFDLEVAKLKLGADGTEKEESKTPEHKAIERELQLLVKATKEGKRNRERAQRAMQKVLGTSSGNNQYDEKKVDEDSGTTSSTNGGMNYSENGSLTGPQSTEPKSNQGSEEEDTPLYHEKQARTHSTIRKRPEGPPPYERNILPVDLSYWQMYRLIMARVAQRLLDIIGEEEGEGFGGRSQDDDDNDSVVVDNNAKRKED